MPGVTPTRSDKGVKRRSAKGVRQEFVDLPPNTFTGGPDLIDGGIVITVPTLEVREFGILIETRVNTDLVVTVPGEGFATILRALLEQGFGYAGSVLKFKLVTAPWTPVISDTYASQTWTLSGTTFSFNAAQTGAPSGTDPYEIESSIAATGSITDQTVYGIVLLKKENLIGSDYVIVAMLDYSSDPIVIPADPGFDIRLIDTNFEISL